MCTGDHTWTAYFRMWKRAVSHNCLSLKRRVCGYGSGCDYRGPSFLLLHFLTLLLLRNCIFLLESFHKSCLTLFHDGHIVVYCERRKVANLIFECCPPRRHLKSEGVR